jgi:RND family efflux transporter MFP subunit
MNKSVSGRGSRDRNSLWRILLPLLIIGFGVALTSTLIALRPAPESRPVAERVATVETITVQAVPITFTVASQGTVQPRTQTTLIAEVSGRVNRVSDKLVAGGFFRQGEILLTLDSADYRVAVDQAQANLLSVQAQLALETAQSEQAAREWDMSGRPREAAPVLALRTPYLREAEARVLYAQSELERAERQLARTEVRAPYDTLLAEKMADIGQYLGTGSQIARLFATDYAEIRLPLSENDLAWLRLPAPGSNDTRLQTPVTLSTSVGGKTRQWQGLVVRTEGIVDSSSRMHYAVARIEDPYALTDAPNQIALPAGTFVNASIEGISVDRIFALPIRAIRNGNQVLLMDSEQRLRQRDINIVRSDAERVYIDQGLADNDIVIVSPVQIPIEGMLVNPVPVQP